MSDDNDDDDDKCTKFLLCLLWMCARHQYP